MFRFGAFTSRAGGLSASQAAAHLPVHVHQRRRRRPVRARASNERSVDNLHQEIMTLQEELSDSKHRGREAQARREELLDVVQGYERLALQCIDGGEDGRARHIMQEKADLQAKLDDAEQRANDFALLATKLQEAIDARQRDIAAAELAAGKEYRDDDAGTSIILGPDGKPMFQRTRNVGDAPLGEDRLRPPPPSEIDDDVAAPSDEKPGPQNFPYPGVLGGSNDSAELMRGARLGGHDQYDPARSVAQGDLSDMVDLDSMLQESDRRLNERFVELERQSLERSLKVSPSQALDSVQPSQRPPPSAPPPEDTAGNPPRSAGGVDLSASSNGKEPRAGKKERAIVAEWWTMGQNALMEGALQETVQSHETSHADAGKALAAVTNAQLRGEEPDGGSHLALVCHCVRSPEQHGAGTWWGAQHAPGAGQLSANMRLAVFGNGLQLVVEDLLTGTTKMLPEGEERRPREARALLVALASALRLSTATASDYSVQVVARAVRACLLNAHAALRQAYDGDDRDAMRKAEQSLEGLHKLLHALPVALPLSMGHAAGKTASDQLKEKIGPVDAMRLDRLYQLVCDEDSTCTSLRAVLEPLFELPAESEEPAR